MMIAATLIYCGHVLYVISYLRNDENRNY
jgi:hypothetical protein